MNPIMRYRYARSMTQADLAQRLGVNINTVRAWESGARPRARYVGKLADALGVEPVQLVDELSAWRAEQSHRAHPERRHTEHSA